MKDFDKPVKKDSAKQLEELEKPTLLLEQPDTPTVANGRMKVFYGKPFFEKYKDVTLIALRITVPLTDKHAKLLPKIMANGYLDINKKGRSRINLRDIPAQRVDFYLESDRKSSALTVAIAKIVKANVALIQRKGEGAAREVVRLSFEVQAIDSDVINTFALKNMENEFWMEISETQKKLWDEDENE